MRGRRTLVLAAVLLLAVPSVFGLGGGRAAKIERKILENADVLRVAKIQAIDDWDRRFKASVEMKDGTRISLYDVRYEKGDVTFWKLGRIGDVHPFCLLYNLDRTDGSESGKPFIEPDYLGNAHPASAPGVLREVDARRSVLFLLDNYEAVLAALGAYPVITYGFFRRLLHEDTEAAIRELGFPERHGDTIVNVSAESMPGSWFE